MIRQICLLLGIALIVHRGTAQWTNSGDNATTGNVIAKNPSNPSAVNMLSWNNDIARIRVGGSGIGAANGFDIQGPSDVSLLRILGNGNIGIGTISTNEKFQVVDGLKMKMSFSTFTVDSGSNEPAMYLSRWIGSGNLYQSHVLHALKGGDNKYGLAFSTSGSAHDYDDKSGISTKMYLSQSGKLGIGTTNPDSKLTVNGNLHAKEVKVDLSVPGPDYVFKEGYNLKDLEEVQKFINENGHLPNIPSAIEMETNGIQLGEMNMKLLEKIEELTLYTLDQQKQLEDVKQTNQKLEQRLRNLENFLSTITNHEMDNEK